jgi:protocatechuate 3,4-dioxygenase beta subunit
MLSNEFDEYRFESNYPPGYFGCPPHILIQVSGHGFQTLATQHYPAKGYTEGYIDLVLRPEN